MVRIVKKNLQQIGDSYAIIIPKKWVDGLKLWKGCGIDLYVTDSEIAITPDWNYIDVDLLASEITVAQNRRENRRVRELLKKWRAKLGNENYSDWQILRILNCRESPLMKDEDDIWGEKAYRKAKDKNNPQK